MRSAVLARHVQRASLTARPFVRSLATTGVPAAGLAPTRPLRSPARALAPLSVAAGVEAISVSGEPVPGAPRIYTSYDVYKGKAALNVKPIAPTLTGDTYRTVQRAGGLLLEMAPAVAGETRTYDWNRKIAFLLSVTELGELLAMPSGGSLDWSHDPAMGSPNAGQVMKKFRLTPMTDGKGVFVNLSLRDKTNNIEESFTTPMTWGEFAVVRTLCEFSIPRLLAFDLALAGGDAHQPTAGNN